MSEKFLKKILITGGSLFAALFCLLPLAVMILMSLTEFPPTQWKMTLVNYQHILQDPALHFFDYVKNSLWLAGTSATAGVLIASLAAYALTRFQLPGRTAVLWIALIASMFPPVSLVTYLFKIMAKLQWINTFPALLLPYIAWSLPLTLWILVSYFSQIPKDLDQAASIDGCSKLQTLRKVIFPVALPGMFSAGLLGFLFAFNEFLFALILTTDHQARPISVGIALFQGLYGQIPWGDLMAASCLVTLPLMVLVVLCQRFIIQGLTSGGIKE